MEVENPLGFNELPAENSGIGASCTFCVKQAKNVKIYMRKYSQVLKENRKLKNKIASLKKQLQSKSLSAKIEEVANVSDQSKTFCKMLLRSSRSVYDDKSRTIAQNIYYVSRKSFLFLRNKLHLNLPHEDSINNWTPIKSLQPGFKNSGLDTFKKQCSTLSPVEKENAVLIFDEMAIREELKYNQKLDIIDGFHDDGFLRTSDLSDHVSVFMVKGLFGNWAFIYNYFITKKGLSGDCIVEIIFKNLAALAEIGVVVKLIVCDQAATNRKAFRLFGVTANNPFFLFNNKKVYCMHDFPHLVKSLRNCLLTNNLQTPDGVVSFKVVEELWEREQKAPTKFCPKLTRQHIAPKSFEKMKVKFATQVFSKTVQAAIKTIVAGSGFKKSSDNVALSTAKFIERIDILFDCMNSCTLNADNKYRSALQRNNDPMQYIVNFSGYLEQIKIIESPPEEGKKKKASRVHFLKGIKLSISATAQLAEEIFEDQTINKFFLCTKALNQDKLENTFSIFRQRGGNNRFPSAAELNGIIAKVMCCKLIQLTSSGNCESTENQNETHLQLIDTVSDEDALPEIEEADEQDQSVAICTSQEHYEKSFSIDVLPSLRYFAGYVAHKILPKIDCDVCSQQVRKVDEIMTAPSELFIFYKNYTKTSDFGSLVAPSEIYFDSCRKHLEIFLEVFENQPQIINVKEHIIKKCVEATSEWFSGPCSQHRLQLLDFFILVLLRKHCLWAVEKVKWTK